MTVSPGRILLAGLGIALLGSSGVANLVVLLVVGGLLVTAGAFWVGVEVALYEESVAWFARRAK